MYNEQLLKVYGSVLLYDYVYLQICIKHFECTDTNAHTIVFVYTTIHPHNTYNTHHTQPPRTHTYTPQCARRMDSFLCLLQAKSYCLVTSTETLYVYCHQTIILKLSHVVTITHESVVIYLYDY